MESISTYFDVFVLTDINCTSPNLLIRCDGDARGGDVDGGIQEESSRAEENARLTLGVLGCGEWPGCWCCTCHIWFGMCVCV